MNPGIGRDLKVGDTIVSGIGRVYSVTKVYGVSGCPDEYDLNDPSGSVIRLVGTFQLQDYDIVTSVDHAFKLGQKIKGKNSGVSVNIELEIESIIRDKPDFYRYKIIASPTSGFIGLSFSGALHGPDWEDPKGVTLSCDLSNVWKELGDLTAIFNKDDRYPHKCPKCGSKAYIGAYQVDCQGGC